MTDISMCLNKDCPLKGNCYRYVAEPSKPLQTYVKFKYNNGCDYYWEFKGSRDVLNQLRCIINR